MLVIKSEAALNYYFSEGIVNVSKSSAPSMGYSKFNA